MFTAPTTERLTEIIISQSTKVIETIRKQERIERLRRIRKSTYTNHGLEEKFGISLTMPSAYNTLKEGENTIWFQREIQKGHVNLLVLTTPYDETIVSHKNLKQIIAKRDSIGKAFIPGRLPNSYLITEKAYEPYVYHTSFGNKPAVEMLRNVGKSKVILWQALFTIHHQRQGQQSKYCIRRFCVCPSTAKRDYILKWRRY